ncbi:hypothetical protein Aca07nite_84700 [Actinoplanes capillaceus]|uniref:TrbC/VIRB2 family protein n=1 Tax=Actinoplanes campanulatus TaxID=113559 RepID=A0ABQ3WYI1_9ACTN|nr:pilin [Actinoplanes capillaceus]GID51195.1 hypothetical protein Aca07nite_84700 [Actinoplanes capillaceus]
MQSKIIKGAVITVAATATLMLAAGAAHAAPPAAPPATYDLATVITHLRWWVCGIIGTVATLFLTIGGVRYLMSGGDPSEIERAKGSFKSAGIGYALALLAPVLMRILSSIVQV